jgi:hypothetical protein
VQATLGSAVLATLVAPSVAPAFPIGARIEVPLTRAIVSYWRPAVRDDLTGDLSVVLDAPPAVGDYNLVWRDSGPEGPGERTEFEVFVPLTVA